MIEVLAKNPDQMFEFDDNEKAKALLVELGLVNRFSKNVPHGPTSTQIVTAEMRTHYIMATLFLGNPIESDNGYLVHAVPKSKFSPAKMGEFMRRMVASYQANGQKMFSSKVFPPDSSDN